MTTVYNQTYNFIDEQDDWHFLFLATKGCFFELIAKFFFTLPYIRTKDFGPLNYNLMTSVKRDV
jgi:hypothetical protein